ncbi:MAG: hypothetical protein JWO36_4326, partial [Myxococcales bacterium]|nr:hypothetical protein [Myxococcales bacterium]
PLPDTLSYGTCTRYNGMSCKSLAFSHDDSWLAVGDSDGMILVYRVKTRELRVTLRRHTSSVTFLAFTGAQLFSGDSEGTVRIWDLATWRHVRAVAKDTGNQRLFFNTLARAVLSGDGRRIAVPVNDRIRIVELGEGTTRTTDLDARQGIHVSALYLFGGDSRLLSAGADGTLVIWPMPPPVLPPPIYAPPPLAAPNPARRFELHDNKSAKFWEVTLDGDAQIVTFGKIGTAGQTQLKEFASDAKARAAYDKLVAQKLGEGYVEVVGGAREAAKPDTRAPAVAERFSDHTKVEVVAGRQVRECSLPAVLKLLDTANAWTRKLGFRVACVPGFDLSAPGSLPGDIPIDVVIGLRVASVSADDGPSGPIDGATLRTGLAHCKELPAAFWDEVADVVSKIFDSVEDTRSLRWHSDDALHLVSTGPLSAGALVFGSVQTRAVAERKFMPFESGTDMRHRPHKKVIAGVRIAAVQMEAPAICTLRLDEEAERGYRDEAAAVPAPHAYHLVARYD